MKNKNFLKKLAAVTLGFVMTLGVGAAGYAGATVESKAEDTCLGTYTLGSNSVSKSSGAPGTATWNGSGSGSALSASKTFTITGLSSYTISKVTVDLSRSNNSGSKCTFTWKFDTETGTEVAITYSNMTTKSQTAYTLFENLSKNGNTFEVKTSNYGNTVYGYNFKLYGTASSVTTYTVSFNANGHGEAPSAISNVSSGNTITKPVDPSCDGFTFNGWYKEESCENEWDFNSDTVTSNITLYAKWTENGGGEETDGYFVEFLTGSNTTESNPTNKLSTIANTTTNTLLDDPPIASQSKTYYKNEKGFRLGASKSTGFVVFKTANLLSGITSLTVDTEQYGTDSGLLKISYSINNSSFTSLTTNHDPSNDYTYTGDAISFSYLKFETTEKRAYICSIRASVGETGPTDLNAPTNLLSVQAGTKTTLSWDTVDNASGYEVVVKLDGSEISGSPFSISSGTTTSLELNDLTPANGYTFAVKSIGDGTDYISSDYSSAYEFSVSILPKSITLTASTIDYDEETDTYTMDAYDSNKNKSMPTITVNPSGVSQEVVITSNSTYFTLNDTNTKININGTGIGGEIKIASALDPNIYTTLVVNVYEDSVTKIRIKSGSTLPQQYISEPLDISGVTFQKYYSGKQTWEDFAETDSVTVPTTGLTEQNGSVTVSYGTDVTLDILYTGAINPSASITEGASAAIYTGKTLQLHATTTPANKSITWASLDTSVATVSDAGLVSGVAAGQTTIYAKYKGSDSYKAAITITVSADYVTELTWSNIGHSSTDQFESGQTIAVSGWTFTVKYASAPTTGVTKTLGSGTDNVHVAIYDTAIPTEEADSSKFITSEYTLSVDDNNKYMVASYNGKFSSSYLKLNVSPGPVVVITKDNWGLTNTDKPGEDSDAVDVTIGTIEYQIWCGYVYSSYMSFTPTENGYIGNLDSYGKYIDKLVVTYNKAGIEDYVSVYACPDALDDTDDDNLVTGSGSGTTVTYDLSSFEYEYFVLEQTDYTSSHYVNISSIAVYLGDDVVPAEVMGVYIKDNGETITSKSVSNYELESTITLTAEVTYNGKSSSSKVDWTSSNTDVATVNGGEITLLSDGSTIIRATSKEDNSKYADITLTLSGGHAEHGTIKSDPLSINEAKALSSPTSGKTYYVKGYFKHLYSSGIDIYLTNDSSSDAEFNFYNFVNKDNYARSDFDNAEWVIVSAPSDKFPLSGTSLNNNVSIVEILDFVPTVSSVTLDKENETLILGQTTSVTITATVNVEHGASQEVTWESSNPNAATVSNGVVTAVGAGETTITATSVVDNTKYDTCYVLVRNPQHTSKITLNKNIYKITEGATETLVPFFNGDDTGVTWSTTDSNIATVDTNGVVTGVVTGSAIITATSTYDPSIKAECYIHIEASSVSSSEILPANISSSYASADKDVSGFENYYEYYQVGNYSGIQFKSGAGYLRSKVALNLDNLVLTYSNSYTCTVYGSTSGKITDTSGLTAITPTESGYVYTYDLDGYSYFYIKAHSSNAAKLSKLNVNLVEAQPDSSIFDNNDTFKNWESGAVTISDSKLNLNFDSNASKNESLNRPIVTKADSGTSNVVINTKSSSKVITSLDLKVDKITSNASYSYQYQTINGGEWIDYVPNKKVTRTGSSSIGDSLEFDTGVYAVRLVVSQGSIVVYNIDGDVESGKTFQVDTKSELAFDYTVSGGEVTSVNNVKIYFTATIDAQYQSDDYEYGIMLAKKSDLGDLTLEEAYADPSKQSSIKVSKPKGPQNSYTVSLSFKDATNYGTEYVYVFYAYNKTTSTYYFGIENTISVEELALDMVETCEPGSYLEQALGLLVI